MRFRPLPLAVATALVLPLGVLPAGASTDAAGAPPSVAAAAPAATSAGATPTAAAPVSVTGEVQRLVVTRTDGSAHDVTVVVPERGDALRVRDEDLRAVATGERVTVGVASPTTASQDLTRPATGAAVVDLATAADEPAGDSASDDVARTLLPHDLDEYLGDPPDFEAPRDVFVLAATLRGQTADGVRTTHLRADVEQHVAPYFAASSDDRVRLRVVGGQTAVAPSWTRTRTCDYDAVDGLLDWAARVAGGPYEPGRGRHVLLYTPTIASCASLRGVAHLADGGVAWVNGTRGATAGYRRSVATQELGHTLGLTRSTIRTGCVGGSSPVDGYEHECTVTEDSPYDVMGDRSSTGYLSGAQLRAVGLLDDRNSTWVSRTGTVTLQPVEGGTGVRFLAVVHGTTSDYVVEYRRVPGARGAPAGVLVHRQDWRPALLRASHSEPAATGPTDDYALAEGESFTSAQSEVRITAVELSGQATIQVTLPPQPWVALQAAGVTPFESEDTAYRTGSESMTRSATVDLTWQVHPSLAVEALELWRNGRRMLTLPADQRAATVTLVDGWNDLVVHARVDGALRARSPRASVVLDRTGPVVPPLELALREGPLRADGAPAELFWHDVTDAGTGVRGVQVLTPPVHWGDYGSSGVVHPVGRATWTVRAEDWAGNTTTRSSTRVLTVVGEGSTVRSGRWTTVTGSAFHGGRAVRATAQGASTSLTFSGRSVAWLASTGPTSGRAEVYLDGELVREVDLRSSSARYRRLVFAEVLAPGRHTIRVVVRGTPGRPAVTSDGFLVLS